MPTGVYERKPKASKSTATKQATTPTKATKRRVRATTPTPVTPEPVNDPNQTSEEWYELRYSEVLEHPVWVKSTATVAKRNLSLAKVKRIRRRIITRSKWEVFE